MNFNNNNNNIDNQGRGVDLGENHEEDLDGRAITSVNNNKNNNH